MSDRFDDVVRNAFDFLGRSIDELSDRPKYSVIHFYSAIELFLKARLLKEHWSLIVAKPEQADKEAFQRGDFQSVGLKEASGRLEKIAGDGLMPEEFACFDGLRKERNQMVHFAHAAQGNGADAEKEMDRIVSDHARGWLYLHRLLAIRWKVHFNAYGDATKEIDGRIRKQTKSLERKFTLLTDEIDAAVKAGRSFVSCPSCRFGSFEVGEPTWIGIGKCLTCGLSASALTLKCTQNACGKPILLTFGYEQCPECEHDYAPEQLLEVLEENGMLRDVDEKDPDDISCASCGECAGYETVWALDNDEWFCTDCFDLTSEVSQCGWCTDYSTHLREDSYLAGCSQCDGRLGHEKDS